MPLEMAKEKITLKQQKGEQTSQILLEGDVIIPDSKPDVKEVLYCQGWVRLDEIKSGEERVAFSGELTLWILYRPVEGERPVYAVTSSLPIQDMIHMDGVDKESAVEIKAELDHLECSMINDRKIGVRAVVEVEAEAAENMEVPILKDAVGENVQLLKEKLRADMPITEKKDRFVVKEEWELPEGMPEIGEILMEHLLVVEDEIRSMDGKVSVKGVLPLTLVYSGAEDGMPYGVKREIPFSGFMEAADATPNTAADVTLTLTDWEIQPQVNEDGESRVLTLSATVGADMTLSEEREEEWVTDAYIPGKKMQLDKTALRLPQTVGRAGNQFVQKEEIRLENGEEPILQVVAIWGDVRLDEMRAEDDAVIAEGTIQAEILYDCSRDENPVCLIQRTFPFSRRIEMKGVTQQDRIKGNAALQEIDFRLVSDGEGEMRAQVSLDLQASRMVEKETLTQIAAEDGVDTKGMAAAVIYTVQPGDSLWKIAKKYHTTVEQILMVNEIENPEMLYPGQKLLIMRMYRG